MTQKVPVGRENFADLRKAGSYYVDKTELLYDLVENTDNIVTLFTRPRRFGKTLTLHMMESFFDIRETEGRQLFQGLSVMNHPGFCEEYMNQYPVLYVSFKDIEGRNFDIAYDMLKVTLSNLCLEFGELEMRPEVSSADAEVFHRLAHKTESEAEIRNALMTIMRMMNAVYGKPVILLIDEYDVPLAKAQSSGYYKNMLDIMRSILSLSLKTNKYLKFAVITGCLRIPKESFFTGVNNFASYSVMDIDFSQYFGFTEDEVMALLKSLGLQDSFPVMKEWYDGYTFGDTKIFCPWDVVNYTAALIRRKTAKPANYWQNTSGNEAVNAFFEHGFDVSEEFETLLNGGTITESVTNALTYNTAYESRDNIWSILLMTGYLTLSEPAEEAGADSEAPRQAILRIPNREIKDVFRDTVVNHFVRTIDQNKVRELMAALWNSDEKAASAALSDLLWHTISYDDYKEDYYHGFTAGVFVGQKIYSAKSNKERGLGRPDIDLRDNANRRAMILEAKVSESEGRMDYWCRDAIRQIIEKEYARNLDGYDTVLCYGIAYYKKKALVRKMTQEDVQKYTKNPE